MLTTRNGLFTAALTGALAAQVPVFAAEQPWHVSGFLSQTLISTSENNFFGHTDDGLSPGYAEAGLLMAGKLSSALELSSQLLMRHAGELDDGRPRVDHLLVTYRLEDDFDRTQGLRVGRGKQHFGLYNETRDVPFTRPGILMPQSTYYDRARNTLLIADEISYFIDAREESGFYSFAIGIFRSLPDKTELTDYFAANNSIQTESGTGSGMQFTWRSPLEQWFIGITAGKTRYGFTTNDTALFNPDGSLNIINSNGRQEVFAANVFVQFIDDPWAITAEYSPINSEFYHLNTLSDYVRNDGLAYYLQVEYHFTPKHEALLRYDVNLSDKSDPDGKQFEHSLIGEVMHFPAFSQYAKDSTLGYAYRPNADWLFRLEFHNVEGTTWLSFRENADPAKLAKYWNMALAQLSYRF